MLKFPGRKTSSSSNNTNTNNSSNNTTSNAATTSSTSTPLDMNAPAVPQGEPMAGTMSPSSSGGTSATITMNSGGIQTTSSGSLNSFNLMSNLARQYAAPIGQRVLLFVAASPECCLEGGVETILKYKAKSASAGSNINSSNQMLSNGSTTTSTAFEESPDGDDFDAFAFLNSQEDAASNNNNNNGNGNGKKKKGFGGFIRQVAASTTAKLERQMQGLAVRMDQGRNPDILRVALYDAHSGELLGVSEPQPVPTYDGDASTTTAMPRNPAKFAIPLVVDGKRRQQSFVIRLWMQSGAAILQTTKALAKNYLLGQATVDCAKLLPMAGSIISIPLSSHLIVGGSLQICPMSDVKFPQLCTRGWSLTDPDMSAYSSQLAYMPLDQSYQMVSNGAVSVGNKWLLATERATESSIVLPLAAAMTEAASQACHTSLMHAQTVGQVLRLNRHDVKDASKAVCQLGVTAVQVGPAPPGPAPTACAITIAWRRPDTIFEVDLLGNNGQVPLMSGTDTNVPSQAAVAYEFYPKVCTKNIMPSLLNAIGGQLPPSGYMLGSLYVAVQVFRGRGGSPGGVAEIWETQLTLDSFVNHAGNTMQIPLYKQGQVAGHALMSIKVAVPSPQERATEKQIRSAVGGLVSLVGLDKWQDGVLPIMDDGADSGDGQTLTASSLRNQQLGTMGLFSTVQYMDQHLALRQTDWEGLNGRAKAYREALTQPQRGIRPHQTRTPKCFRPSSSRPTELLSGLPFNAHNATFNIAEAVVAKPPAPSQELPGALYHNITCGAPADHARGFGNILEDMSKTVTAAGGLRRLQAKRVECYQHLQQAQSQLIAGVGTYLASARQATAGGQIYHVPSRHTELQALRWQVFECVQNLHHVTWHCAVRRSNVFSQSLGLALTSYMASISDLNRISSGWPELWKRHGFLVSYEGLLSAVGKELGMIEDASVAIAMLRMVSVTFVSNSGQSPPNAVTVPSSPYLKWVDISTTGGGASRQFLVQVGVDDQYYQQRIPPTLQNGATVRFFPILWEVGVDIRQWGAHNAKNMQQQMNRGNDDNEQQAIAAAQAAEVAAASSGSILDDDDDDDSGDVPDDDVLVALNFEALRKMNAYTYAINPQNVPAEKVQASMQQVFAPNYAEQQQGAAGQQQEILPVHPSLSLLHSHILSSAGKMNHSILDEAATIAQQLGGGGLIFCKSGKDRTAMHLTYKQAQFAARFQNQHDTGGILKDATMMRLYGTRLPVCEKNVGESKYAFNSLQVKFMPEALKPPLTTLAGFKFSIES